MASELVAVSRRSSAAAGLGGRELAGLGGKELAGLAGSLIGRTQLLLGQHKRLNDSSTIN